MTLFERLKIKCLENNTNFSRIEKELGFGNATLKKWEHQNPSYDKVMKVADKLNVSIEWLITGKESTNLSPEEQELIDLYRQADERGKKNIMNTAHNERMEPESSTTKIG